MAPISIKVTTQGANYKQNHLNGDDAEIGMILYVVFTMFGLLIYLKTCLRKG